MKIFLIIVLLIVIFIPLIFMVLMFLQIKKHIKIDFKDFKKIKGIKNNQKIDIKEILKKKIK